ncbi:carbon storage regulator CsrA [Pseudoxanthomonas sp. LjRoot168]|uniref:carbon storage regulator CsrA n=1 Tax=unclassified Pseudoxanthomonas TaxID=2645906 RepID=UPI003ECFAB55
MIIITRTPGESICIGDSIIVQVTKADVGQVRLGIKAPKDVAIHRQEIYDKIQAGVPNPKDLVE